MKFQIIFAALAVAAGIMVGGLKVARGELVFEDDLTAPAATAPQAPVATPTAVPTEESKEVSSAEAMRRQRVRTELKNEDLLSQKLEELRLKDEMKRTDVISGNLVASGVAKDVSTATAGFASPADSLQEQRIGSAASPAAPTGASGVSPVAVSSPSLAVQTAGPVSATSVLAADDKAEEEKTRVTLVPRGGMSGVTNSIYSMESRFAAGLGVVVDANDYIAFAGGYTYSSYNLTASTNMLVYPVGGIPMLQQLQFNDNEFDLGARGYVLGSQSRVRPFMGAGVAYRRGYVNYNDATLAYVRQYNPYATSDVTVSGFAGYIEAGLDFKITKAISIVGSARYFNMFSSSQNNPLDPNALVNPGAYNYGYGYSNDVRSQAGNALANNNFYQLMAGVGVSF